MEEFDGAHAAIQKGLALDADNANLVVLDVQLLIRARKLDVATKKIEGRLAKNIRDRDMYLLYHQLELVRGDEVAAARVLERGMNTCCASGKCGPQDREIPRSLIGHYLKLEQNPKRVNELLGSLFQSQSGQGEWIDHFLRARYHKWQGDDDKGRQNWEAALDKLPDDHPNTAEVRALYG